MSAAGRRGGAAGPQGHSSIQLIHTPITHQYFSQTPQPNWIFFFPPTWSMTGIPAAEEGGGASKDRKQEVPHGALKLHLNTITPGLQVTLAEKPAS